jgi:hypothetical protein
MGSPDLVLFVLCGGGLGLVDCFVFRRLSGQIWWW